MSYALCCTMVIRVKCLVSVLACLQLYFAVTRSTFNFARIAAESCRSCRATGEMHIAQWGIHAIHQLYLYAPSLYMTDSDSCVCVLCPLTARDESSECVVPFPLRTLTTGTRSTGGRLQRWFAVCNSQTADDSDRLGAYHLHGFINVIGLCRIDHAAYCDRHRCFERERRRQQAVLHGPWRL